MQPLLASRRYVIGSGGQNCFESHLASTSSLLRKAKTHVFVHHFFAAFFRPISDSIMVGPAILTYRGNQSWIQAHRGSRNIFPERTGKWKHTAAGVCFFWNARSSVPLLWSVALPFYKFAGSQCNWKLRGISPPVLLVTQPPVVPAFYRTFSE
ncbi:hypothetical protein VTG60DRAFT_2519 [Thermothelomyces hinnuleus]